MQHAGHVRIGHAAKASGVVASVCPMLRYRASPTNSSSAGYPASCHATGATGWSATGPSDAPPPLSMQKQPAHPLLRRINSFTKWGVSGFVLFVFLYFHNLHAAWCVVGAVVSSVVCKALKYLINEKRPDQANKKDPGMPSSHANSLNFLSTYAALSLTHFSRSQGPGGEAAAGILSAAAIAAGLFMTWLRVAVGVHTWPQVTVGAVLGATTATAWFTWGVQQAVSALRSWPPGVPLLYTCCVAAMAGFAAFNVRSWVQERAEKQRLRQAAAVAQQAGSTGDISQQQQQQKQPSRLLKEGALLVQHAEQQQQQTPWQGQETELEDKGSEPGRQDPAGVFTGADAAAEEKAALLGKEAAQSAPVYVAARAADQ